MVMMVVVVVVVEMCITEELNLCVIRREYGQTLVRVRVRTEIEQY